MPQAAGTAYTSFLLPHNTALSVSQMKTIKPEIETLWLGTVDQGKQLEFNATIDGLSTPLATIVAEAPDESHWLEVYVHERAVRIPIDLVTEAIQTAKGKVHSEAWYEKNAYPKA